jgi:DNA repair exonuclease SbcCD ATPase subunit
MTYKIGNVTYTNFGPFESATVNLCQDGLTVIEGLVDNNRGADSNGAGKSFVLDGVAWALFGRCIRAKYSGDEVMRRIYEKDDNDVLQVKMKGSKVVKPAYAKGGTSVSVELVGGDYPVTVTRYRKHPTFKDTVQLEVGGEDVTRGRNDMTNIAIEQILGLDFTTFSNSVAFAARDDIKSFFNATDTDRKAILDRILGLEVYSDALLVAKERLKQTRSDASESEDEVKRLQTLIHTQKQTLQEEQENAQGDTLSRSVKKSRLRLKTLMTDLQGIKEAVVAKSRLVLTERGNVDVRFAAYEEKQAEYDDSLLAATRFRREHEDTMLKIKSLLHEATDAIESVEDLEGGECPTCYHDVTTSSSLRVLKVLQARHDDLTGTYEGERVKVIAVDEMITNLRADAPTAPIESLMETLQLEASQLAHSQAETTTSITSLTQEIERFDSIVVEQRQRREKLALKIEQAQLDLEAAKEAFAGYAHAITKLEACVIMFGNGGLKSFLIEAAIPEVNRHACVYAQRLCGAGAYVRISATTTTKSAGNVREKLSVQGCIPGAADSYEGASKGQKKRLDLALLLSFREVVANRSQASITQLFADELFDGLDRSGTDSVVDLLRDITDTCPVILVTHDDRLKSVGDQTILIRHSDGIASIVGQPATRRRKKKLNRALSKTNG